MEWMNLTDACDINDKSVQEFEGLKEYVATGDIDFNNIIASETITYNNKPSRANREVSNGDIIFAKMKGTIKVLKITEEVSDKYIFSTGFTTLNAKLNKLTQSYLYYILISDIFQNQKDKYSSGATQKAINNTNLKKIKIPVPSLAIQEQIVEVLDMAQELIDKRKAQLDAMDSLIESIFYSMFGDPVRNEKGWEVKKLGELGRFISGGTPSRKVPEYFKGSIPWITTVALGKFKIGKEDSIELITEEAIYNSATKLIPKGSIMIGTRVGIGKISINSVEMCTNQDIVSMTDIKESINLRYIFNTLSLFQVNLQSKSRGATIKGINMEVLKSITIPIPPLNLQNEFAQKVELIEREKELLEESLELMEENYRSIMDRAFKGELFK